MATDRCTAHGLAVGPDGRCVLCRREAASPSAPAPAGTARVPLASLVFVGLGLAVGAGYFFLRPADAPLPAEAAPRPEPPVPATEADPGAPRLPSPVPVPREREAAKDPAPSEPAGVEERVEAPKVAAPERAPNADDLQAAMRAVRITVYTTTWCPHCTRARNWLRANGIAYTERDIEASESARRERDRINPKGGVPTADIDGDVLTGFGETNWSRAIARATQRRLEQRAR